MSRSAAVPVPPPAAFTLTFTPPVVVIELPAFIVKPWAPAASAFALIVTVPEQAFIAPERVTSLGELIAMLPVVAVKPRTVVILPGLNGAVVEGPTVRLIFPVPALRFAPAPKAMSPVVALARFAPMAVESLAVREIFPLVVLMPALT